MSSIADEIEAPLPSRLRALAGELVRLQPSRTDPEAYYVAKSEIVEGLRRAAREVDWTRPPVRSIVRPAVDAAPPIFQKLKNETRPPRASAEACRHCRRRRAQQSYRHRLRLPTGDLFAWAGIDGR